MNKLKKKLRTKVFLGTVLLLLIAMLALPLLIPVRGEDGFSSPEALMESDGKIVELPFDGTDGIEVYYEFRASQSNSNKNFILLHGSQYNSSTWHEVIDYLATKGNVYAYDQIPYGLSEKMLSGDWQKENPYTLDATMKQLTSFMDLLDIDKATLVGSSYGGVIAAEAAVRFPDRVENLIFVDAAIYVNESMPGWLISSPQMSHLGPKLSKYLGAGDTFYERIYYDASILTEDRIAQNKLMTKFENWNLAYWEYLKAWGANPSDIASHLDEINQNALVISGAYDEIVPVSQSEQLAKSLPNATLNIIQDCGHMPQEEKPEAFIQSLELWMSKLEK